MSIHRVFLPPFSAYRPVNLVVMSMTAIMLHYKVVKIYFSGNMMNNGEFILLLISLLLIASGGYIINDFYDEEIDVLNKKNPPWIQNFPQDALMKVYYLLTITGILASFILSYYRNMPAIGVWVSLSALSLYAYAKSWKKILLGKNVIICLLLTFPVLLTVYADGLDPNALWSRNELFYRIIRYFVLLAFMLNASRELVKDIMDLPGDRVGGVHSIPLMFGEKKTYQVIQVLLWISIVIILYYNGLFNKAIPLFSYVQYGIAGLLFIFSIIGVFINKNLYAVWLSRLLKILMLAGIVSLSLVN